MDPKDKALLEGFPLVPREEINRRIEAFCERMRRKGIDIALIFQNVDLYYLSGTVQKGYLIVARDGESLLWIQRDPERARWESPLEVKPAQGLGEILETPFLKGAKTVGLEFDVLPVGIYLRLKGMMEGVEFVDISPEILALRARKSPYELEQMRKASSITAEVLKRAKELLRPGMAELELDALLQAEGRKRGHHGWLRMRGLNQEMAPVAVLSGPNGGVSSYVDAPLKGLGTTPAIGYGTSNRLIGRDEPVIVDYGAGYNGYVTDETRTYVIGSLPPRLEEAYGVALEILDFFEGHARPGVIAKNLYLEARKIAERRGFGDHFMGFGKGQVRFVAHGIGLEINEWPVIAHGREEELQEGMVFALEPKFVFPGQGAVGVEVDYVVTQRGLERLNSLPPALFYL